MELLLPKKFHVTLQCRVCRHPGHAPRQRTASPGAKCWLFDTPQHFGAMHFSPITFGDTPQNFGAMHFSPIATFQGSISPVLACAVMSLILKWHGSSFANPSPFLYATNPI